jgi:dienelactone hydrolase
MFKINLPAFFFLLNTVASGATLTIPAADGALTVDGRVEEDIWARAVALPLQLKEFGAPFPAGGEMRAIVRRGYLCLSARLPETGRVVAKSIGRDPVWWREDLVIWTFRLHDSQGQNKSLTLTVNPLGAYSVDPHGTSSDPQQGIRASASLGLEGWSVEAAIPVARLAKIGFVTGERIRVSRPDAPELRWHWPGVNDALDFELPSGDSNPQPPTVVEKDWRTPSPPAVRATSADPLVIDLASVPRQVWTAAERKDLGVQEMWERDLGSRVSDAALAERRAWEQVVTVADWEAFRSHRLDALKASFGPFPERTPLRAAVTRHLDYGDGFVLENVVFESRPGLVVTANLYLPAKSAGRMPAIIVVHSHHAPKVQSELQDMGMTWARSGTAVLIMDQLGAGERLQSQPWPRESYYSRYNLGIQLYLAGESLIKWMVWDLTRGIDLLLERPEVDPNRIVLLGSVAGGGDPAAVTAALDHRFAAVLPFNFGEAGPEEHYTEGPRAYNFETADPGWGEWESTRCLRQSISGQFFPWMICVSVAPRRFVYSFEVSWPNSVEKEPAWARYKKVFDLYGQQDHLAEVHGFGPFPGPGECTNVGTYLRKQIYPILARWLDFPIPSEEYHNVRPDADLMCLTSAAAAERRPRTASEIAYQMAAERLSAARTNLASRTPADRLQSLRASLAVKLGDIEPPDRVPGRILWTRTFSSLTAEGIELQLSPGLRLPLLLLKPQPNSFGRLPVILALAQAGKDRFLVERSTVLAELLKRGTAVCLADVRGTGEVAPGSSTTSLVATELMLGNTALGARMKDTRAIFRYLSGRQDLSPRRVVLWGDSFAPVNPRGLLLDQSVLLEPGRQEPGPQAIQQAQPVGGLLALLTALYEDNVHAVAVSGGMVSFLSVLKDRFCYVPQDIVVPGILERGDIEDIVAELSPRAVLLEGLVDGRDRLLSASDLEGELGGARAAYRGTPSNLAVREQADESSLAVWMAQQAAQR